MSNKNPSFSHSFMDFENMEMDNEKTIEFYDKIKQTGDHRSRVILSGIIIEYHLDRLLQILFVDYDSLTEKSEFSFSLKISTLRALRFIPTWILTSCDCIRKTRNEFAHHLNIVTIDDIDNKIKSNIVQCYNDLKIKQSHEELIMKYEGIHNVVSGELQSYKQNFRLLREKIDSKEFIDELDRINNERIYKQQEELIARGPIKIIDRGNEIEEFNSKTFSRIRNK